MNQEQEKQAIKILDTTEVAEIEGGEGGNKKKRLFKEIFSYLILIGIAFMSAQLIHHFVFTPVSVSGRSMEPAIYNNDYVFLWRLSKIERLVVYVFQANENYHYIKRIIGLPGDYVEMREDVLYINGEVIEEPYLEQARANSNRVPYTKDFTLEIICSRSKENACVVMDGVWTIAPDYYLVLGDNRPDSHDSIEMGLIHKDLFIGEAKIILFPFSRFANVFLSLLLIDLWVNWSPSLTIKSVIFNHISSLIVAAI